MEELKEDYQLALEGRKCWLGLKKKYEIDDNCCLIICPTEDQILNRIAMENLKDYLKRKYLKKAVVITSYLNIKEYCPYIEKIDIYFEYMEEDEVEGILKYYRLTQFAKNIVVIYLEEPFGNGNIIGHKGISLVDYVKNAIYR